MGIILRKRTQYEKKISNETEAYRISCSSGPTVVIQTHNSPGYVQDAGMMSIGEKEKSFLSLAMTRLWEIRPNNNT